MYITWFINLYFDLLALIYRAKRSTFRSSKLPGTISYLTLGRGSETLLFLPGFANTKEACLPALYSLSKKYKIVVMDLPGFGRSFKNIDERYTLESYALWVKIFIDSHFDRQPFHLVACSLGGATAVKILTDQIMSIKSLTLVDSAGFYLSGNLGVYQSFLDKRNIFVMETFAEFKLFFKTLFVRPPTHPLINYLLFQYFKAHNNLYQKIGNDLFSFSSSELEESSLNHLLHTLKENYKISLIWGDGDQFFPLEYCEFLSHRLGAPRTKIIASVGHSPHLEKPHEFARVLKDCLKIS